MAEFKSGTISKFLVGAQEIFVNSIRVAGTVEVGDVTHTGAGGDQVLVGGVRRRTYTIGGGYDFDANYHADPPDIKEGDIITAVHAKPDGTLDYTSGALVVSFEWTGGPSSNATMFTAEMRSTGSLSWPTTP